MKMLKMKKIFLVGTLAAASLFTFTGCLKDKDFENQKYGTQIREMKGVAFPEAASGPLAVSVTSSSTSQTIDGATIVLEQDGNAASDVQVTLQINNALVTAAGLTPLPTTAFSIVGGNTVTIPAGQKQVMVKLAFPNSAALSPTTSYGLGLTISSVSGGYTIAKNQKDLVFSISVKNLYDGIYSVVSGKVTRYTAPGTPANDALSGNLAGNPDVKLITTGPNSVSIPAPATPNPGTIYWANGQNSQVAGIDGLSLTINPSTNAVTVSSAGNATLANWAGSTPGITYNRYDPATKTFYLAFRWNPTANVREYEIVLKYKGPR
jgi:hypothetical protein